MKWIKRVLKLIVSMGILSLLLTLASYFGNMGWSADFSRFGGFIATFLQIFLGGVSIVLLLGFGIGVVLAFGWIRETSD